jgi:hypothetical protein
MEFSQTMMMLLLPGVLLPGSVRAEDCSRPGNAATQNNLDKDYPDSPEGKRALMLR